MSVSVMDGCESTVDTDTQTTLCLWDCGPNLHWGKAKLFLNIPFLKGLNVDQLLSVLIHWQTVLSVLHQATVAKGRFTTGHSHKQRQENFLAWSSEW